MADKLALPEFTRSLRGFASVRGLGTKTHELVFGPLLAARRSAARVQAPDSQVAAFDAERLRRALSHAIAAIAADRSGDDAATRRALEARLGEAAAPAVASLAPLAECAQAVRAAPLPARAEAWDRWCDAVQAVFEGFDRFWLAIDRVAPPDARGPLRLNVPLALLGALMLSAGSLVAQHTTVRVERARPDSLLAAGFDVVGADAGAALVVVTPRDRDRLVARGLGVTEMHVARARLGANAQATTTVYRSFDDPVRGIRKWVDSIATANTRVSVDTIGTSYEGRPLLALKIGPKGDSPQRPNVIFMATYHAREWAATEMALRLAQYLAAPPGSDARRDSLVQGRDIWIIPVANPDGYQYTFTNDRLWRKTRSPQAGGAVGVDMNRNHSVDWGFDNQGSSSDPKSDIYRGPAPASESETRAIETFDAAHPPVVSVSYHTYAGLLIYPPTHIYGALPADLPVYRTVAGTHLRSAAADHLPGSIRSSYAPGPGWELYTTNGEYTDFAASRFGTIAFTQELTSGYGTSGYYGFEFPDDDALLGQMFQDALPFALDLLDAASSPAAFVSATTGRHTDRITIESVSPAIQAIVPADAASTVRVATDAPLAFHVDSAAGGRYTRRVVTGSVGRPTAFSVTAGGVTAAFRVLALSGAESGDAAWTASGFTRDSSFAKAGAYSWRGVLGTLTSAPVSVPADVDTVSVLYWTMHFGSGFTPSLEGKVDVSADGGASWMPVAIDRGSAPVWYADGARIGGVHGKSLTFRFTASGMDWRLDEITVLGHGAVTSAPVASGATLRPSENPVRSGAVRFTWPFGQSEGDIRVFDFSGHEVWRSHVTAGATASWDVESLGVSNGVYLIVARAGSRVERLKLFVARRAP